MYFVQYTCVMVDGDIQAMELDKCMGESFTKRNLAMASSMLLRLLSKSRLSQYLSSVACSLLLLSVFR